MATPQLTVRGIDDELAKRLRQHCEHTGLSLSQAALDLLRRGAGLGTKPAPVATIGHSLDLWFGTWDATEAAAVTEAVADFAIPDPQMWR